MSNVALFNQNLPDYLKEVELDDSEKEMDLEDLSRRIAEARLPEAVERIAEQERDILSKISATSAEFTISLTYIDYLLSLPWNVKTEDNLDIARAEKILNENHYGLRAERTFF